MPAAVAVVAAARKLTQKQISALSGTLNYRPVAHGIQVLTIELHQL